MATQSFVLPEQYGGKSLSQIYKEVEKQGGYFPSAALAQDLGVGFEQPLSAGQQFNFNVDPGSGGYQFLQKNFTPLADYQKQQAGKTQQEADARAAQQAMEQRQILQQSSQAAIGTLEQGRAPLKQRYDDVIASIKGTKQEEVQRADVTSAQELARRGIPTSSTYAGEYQQERRLPVETAFQSQE